MTYISAEYRKLVVDRAFHICEYCLIHEEDTFYSCEIDHIISLKHGGLTEPSNLAYACIFCNRSKGTDIGSILLNADTFVRFFNPRNDSWSDHFQFDGVLIKPISDIGAATIKILDLNNVERLMEREALAAIGRYPPAQAFELIQKQGP